MATGEGSAAERLKHPIFVAIVTFLLTGVVASFLQNWLSSKSKERDLELATSQRAAESVRVVTELIFERAFRANMLASSIKRTAPSDELKDRKQSYDTIFVSYNSKIQSNIFRIREMFAGDEYALFKKLLQGPVRDLLLAQDQCVTFAYDAAVSSDANRRQDASKILASCDTERQEQSVNVSYQSIHDAILNCEYSFSDALFRAAEKFKEDPISAEEIEKSVTTACAFPESNAVSKLTPGSLK